MSISRNYLWAGAAAMVSLGAQGAVAQTSLTIDMAPGAGAVSMDVSSRGFDEAAQYVRGCPGFVPDSVDGANFDVAAGVNQLFFEAQGPDTVALVIESPAGTYSCAVADGGTMAHGLFRPAPGQYAVFPSGRVLGERITTTLSASVDGAPPTTPVEPPQPPVAQTGVIDIARLGPPRQGTVRLDRAAAMERQLVAEAPFTVTTRANDVTPDDVWCAGHIAPDAADVVFDLYTTAHISFFTLSDGDPVLAIRDPSGNWRCNDDSFGLNSALTYQRAEPGQYHIWVGSFGSTGRGSYQLFASLGDPRWTTETINTDGEPRAGRVRLDLMEARTRQTLATAPIASPTRIDALIPGMYCAGHVDTDGPDVVLTVDQAQDVLSIYAMSSTDLTLSVLGPDDRWSCNDDTFGLNPAITYNNAMPGEYRIWVGSFGANRRGTYELFATAGAPRWVDAELEPTAAPSAGYVSIGTGTDRGFRLPIVMEPGRIPARSFSDGFCPGFITPDRPTVIVTIEDSLPELTFYAVSDADGMMLIQTPDGSLLCNDDFQGLNPGIVINDGAPGDYAVWVGTYGGRGGTGTFGVTQDVPLWTVDRDL